SRRQVRGPRCEAARDARDNPRLRRSRRRARDGRSHDRARLRRCPRAAAAPDRGQHRGVRGALAPRARPVAPGALRGRVWRDALRVRVRVAVATLRMAGLLIDDVAVASTDWGHGGIDTPTPGDSLDTVGFTVSGWAVGSDGPIGTVEISARG